MVEKYNAIVLRSVSYRDSDKIVTLFTLENGIISASLRGVNKPNAKLRFAAEPFCFGEFILAKKDGRRTVVEVNQIDSFYGLRLDSDKYLICCAMAEFVMSMLLDGMESYELFSALIKALKITSSENVEPKKLLIIFFLIGLKQSGYELNFAFCSRCGGQLSTRAFFSFGEGISSCSLCAVAHDIEIRFSTYVLLKACSELISLTEVEDIISLNTTDEVLLNAIKLLDYAFKQNTGQELKSLRLIIG